MERRFLGYVSTTTNTICGGREWLTLKMDGRIGICFGGIGNGLLDPFFIVVAVDLVAVVVNERWVSVDDDALVAGMFDDLFVSLWARGRSEGALPHEPGPLL